MFAYAAWSWRLNGQERALQCSCGRLPPAKRVLWLVAHLGARRVAHLKPDKEITLD